MVDMRVKDSHQPKVDSESRDQPRMHACVELYMDRSLTPIPHHNRMGPLDQGTRLAKGTSAEAQLHLCRPGWSGLC